MNNKDEFLTSMEEIIQIKEIAVYPITPSLLSS